MNHFIFPFLSYRLCHRLSGLPDLWRLLPWPLVQVVLPELLSVPIPSFLFPLQIRYVYNRIKSFSIIKLSVNKTHYFTKTIKLQYCGE